MIYVIPDNEDDLDVIHEVHGAAILAADVKQAFDNVTPAMVAEHMAEWMFPSSIIRALVMESMFLRGTASASGLGSTEPFGFTACIRQGGVESPWSFNLVIRTLLRRCQNKWPEGAVHLPVIGDIRVLAWADNLYFVGCMWEAAVETARVFTEELHAAGLE